MPFVLYVECCIKCLCQACQIETGNRSRNGVLLRSHWHIFVAALLRSQACETPKRSRIRMFWQTIDNEKRLNKALITKCCKILRKMSVSSRTGVESFNIHVAVWVWEKEPVAAPAPQHLGFYTNIDSLLSRTFLTALHHIINWHDILDVKPIFWQLITQPMLYTVA